MKKRIASLICAVSLSVALTVQPVFAVNETVLGTSEESMDGTNQTETSTEGGVQTEESAEESRQTQGSTEEIVQQETSTEGTTVQQETSKESENQTEAPIADISETELVVKVSDDGTSVDIKLNGFFLQSEGQVEFDIFNPEADEEDAYVVKAEKEDNSYLYKEDLKRYKKIGTYKVKAYEKKSDTERVLIKETSFEVKAVSVDEVITEAINDNQFKVYVDGVNSENRLEKFKVKVWTVSEDEGKWYDLNRQQDGTYAATIDTKDYDDYSGKYMASVYAVLKNEAEQHLQNTEIEMLIKEEATVPQMEMFSLNRTVSERVEISNQNNSNGTFDVQLYTDRSESNISEVIVPVWTTPNQSDIYWYRANRQSDGSYKVTVDIKNHQYHYGNYIVHTYVKDEKGTMNFIEGKAIQVEASWGAFAQSSTGREDSVHLTLDSVYTQGAEEKIEFAVWSAEGGQDDIYWYQASSNGNNYSADVMLYNHKSTGKYYAHAYLKDKNGNMHFLEGISFEVKSLPKETVEIQNQNNQKGTFDVRIYLSRSQSDIDEVIVPVWTTANQSDICWYRASRQWDGSYKVTVDVKNHQYNFGRYIVHTYVKDKSGNMNFIEGVDAFVECSAGNFVQESLGRDDILRLTLNSVNTQNAEEKIEFAVWSAERGQDDIYWYQASSKGNNYSADIMLYNHKSTGTYYAHAYLKDKNGGMHLLKELNFQVKDLPEETVEIINFNEGQGTFDVKVYLTRPQNMVKEVIIPVWTAWDQSDIYWYKATRQSDGSYKITVDATNHQWHSGRYIVHAYVKTYQDEMMFVKEKNVDMNLGTRIVTEKIDTRSVRVKIYGIDARVNEMKFPTWSLVDGQDDIVWYTAQKNSDGSWSAEISSRYHNVAGKYICDLYVVEAGKYTKVGGTEVSIDEKWEGTWRWIDGYKRYINANGDIDNDVSRLVSGPYLIKVYKWSNYLIIYAKDENGNYNVPVKAMITSCGNPTPTGTYYSPNKFRWLTMVGGSKAQWCTQISGDYLFHSVPYRIADPTTLYTDLMYNFLGTTQSLGCIRLQAGDAKWIYDNCELGTEIYITPWESNGPIAKPAFSPIPSWHTWDPTDPNVRYLCEQRGCH